MATSASTSHVTVEHDGPITTITLNRAQRRNAVVPAMMQQLIEAAEGLRDRESCRAVVLRAAGDHFSVGADLEQRREADAEPPSLLMRRRNAELGSRLMRSLQQIHQPTVCAIQGVATGAGACIATACDFRIAAADARLGYGEVKLGINLMWHAVGPCLHLVGPARAKRMIMTGKLFDAPTLERWGFLDEVTPPSELDQRALAWAREYVELPPVAVQMIKRSIQRLAAPLDEAILHADTDQWVLTAQSEDFQEAVSAFFDKRRPTFRGN